MGGVLAVLASTITDLSHEPGADTLAMQAGIVRCSQYLRIYAWLRAPSWVAEVKIGLEFCQTRFARQRVWVPMADFWDVDAVQHGPLCILVAPLPRESVVATRLATIVALSPVLFSLEEPCLELSKGGLLCQARVPLWMEVHAKSHGPSHVLMALGPLNCILAICVAPEAADHLAAVQDCTCAWHGAAAPIAIVQVGLEVCKA